MAAKHQERLEKELKDKMLLIEHLQMQMQKMEEECNVLPQKTLKLEAQVQLLTKHVGEYDTKNNNSVPHDEELLKKNNELKELLNDANKRTRDLEEELLNMRSQCLDHVIDSQVSASELRLDMEQTRKRIGNEAGVQRAENLRAHQDMVNRMIQMGEKSRESEQNMKKLQIEDKILAVDMASKIQKLGDQEQQDLIHGTLKTLEIENQVLNMRNAHLERESVKDARKCVNEGRKSDIDGIEISKSNDIMKSEDDMDSVSELSDFTMFSQRFGNQITQLQNQMEMYKRDVKHNEMICDNLQEKSQLEELVQNLQHQQHEQRKLSNAASLENLTTEVQSQNHNISNSLLPIEKVKEFEQEMIKSKETIKLLKDEKEYLGRELEAMARVVQDLESKVAKGEAERQDLESSMEELDQQHQDAVDKLLALRNTDLLENEQLKSQVLEMKLAASDKLKLSESIAETTYLHSVHVEGTTQTDCIHQYNQENQSSFIHHDKESSMDLSDKCISNERAAAKYDSELCEEIRKLINFDIPSDIKNTIPQSVYLVQEIVKVVNDCKWKRDTLERKVAELIRENKDFQCTITILEADCTHLKDNVERLAEQLVGVAKSSSDPLPIILENCEETELMEQKIAMLEEEIAVLKETRVNFEEDVGRMREDREDLLGQIRNLEAQQKNQENVETELQRFTEDAQSSAQGYKEAAEMAEKARMSAENKIKSLTQELEVCVERFEKQLTEIKDVAKNLGMKNNELLEEVMSKEVKLEQYHSKVVELDLENNSLKKLLLQNTSCLEESKNVLEEKGVLQGQLSDLQKELDDSVHEREKLNKICADLKENLKVKVDLEAKLELTGKNLHDTQLLIKDQEQMRAELKKWQCAAAAEELKVRDTIASLFRLEEINCLVTKKLQIEESSTKSLAQKNEKYIKEIQELKDILGKEVAKVNNEQIIEDLQLKHHSEMTALRNDKYQVEQSLSTTLQHHNLLNKEIETLKLDLLKKEQVEVELQQNISTLEAQVNNLHSDLQDGDSGNSKMLEDNRGLTKKNSVMECNKNDSILANEKVKSLESQVHFLQVEKEILVEENLKLKASVINDNKCTYVPCENASLENNISTLCDHSKRKNTSKVTEIKLLQDEKLATLTLLEERTRELHLLQARVNDLNMKVNENNETVKQLDEQKDIIMNEKAQLDEKFTMTKEMVSKLSQIITEKDQELCDLNNQLSQLPMVAQKCDSVNKQLVHAQESTVQVIQERDQLLQTVQVKHQESVQYHAEIQRLSTVLAQEIAKNQHMAVQYATLVQQYNEEKANASLQHEQEIKQLQVKDDGLQQLCNRLELKEQELQARGMEIEMLQRQIDMMVQDRAVHRGTSSSTEQQEQQNFQDIYKELLSKFQDEQRRSKTLQTEFESCQGRETALQRELERLRVHLVEIEDIYTQDALKREELVKELMSKVQQAEEMMKSSSTVYKSANIRANQQVETLQEQARLIAQQRDDVQVKLSSAEDQVAKHSAALRNLQVVLEQFQRDREREIEAARMSVYTKVEAAQKRHNELLEKISSLKFQLGEAKEGLSAASRLGEELEKKAEIVNRLKLEVGQLEEKVLKAEEEAKMVGQTVEGKVDKSLVKNVILGFFLAPSNSKEQVLHVVAHVLDFSEDEKNRIQKRLGLHSSEVSGGWFKSLLHPASQNQSHTQSLSEAFVHFLENESIPQPKLKMLPDTEKQASDISNNPRETPPVTTQRKSPLLLADVQLPTLGQFPVGRNSSSILKDILK